MDSEVPFEVPELTCCARETLLKNTFSPPPRAAYWVGVYMKLTQLNLVQPNFGSVLLHSTSHEIARNETPGLQSTRVIPVMRLLNACRKECRMSVANQIRLENEHHWADVNTTLVQDDRAFLDFVPGDYPPLTNRRV